MKRILPFLSAFFLLSDFAIGQHLPHYLTEAESHLLPYAFPESRGFTTPPASDVRTPAEWEEIDGICVRWEGTWSRSVVRNIVKYAKEECTVYIVTENENSVVNHLNQYGIDQNNIVFVDEPTNSIWMRDYGQWNVYTNEVDSVLWVDWIYNRPRPLDNVIPEALSDLLNIPLYVTSQAPNNLVNTGGNFMVDGFGTGFASELVLEENDATNQYGTSNHSESDVDQIMEDFMGIDRYIKMPTLPYDGIHHIDMHMKLLDEETLLVGEYPPGIADGPQIESNLNYILNNFNSVYGTPYKVIRVEMPPEGGAYPNTWGDYRTYTNSVFINKTILVPIYEEQWDTTALRIYREALPGYKVIGIDCNEIIQASGAIHCITKAVSAADPLLIRHQPLEDMVYTSTDHPIDAMIKHADGIDNATLYWTTDTLTGYAAVGMTFTNSNEDTWSAGIPYQQEGEKVFYYIHAEATNGKQQVRPITAPQGYWMFSILDDPTGLEEVDTRFSVYPNPSSGVFHINLVNSLITEIEVTDVTGKILFESNPSANSTQLDLSAHPSGIYLLRIACEGSAVTQRLNLIH